MVLNGVPKLACASWLREYTELTIEPLSKFPIIQDLRVDRSKVMKLVQHMQGYTVERTTTSIEESTDAYQTAQCLQCGCCLEVCPNFTNEDRFVSAMGLNHAYMAVSQEKDSNHKKEILQAYQSHFFNGCGQALSCVKVCPNQIPLDRIQARIAHKKVK